MLNYGDLHNFGRRVTWLQSEEGPFLFKPRTVAWEELFFGKSSKLLPWIRKSQFSNFIESKNISVFENAIFGLEILRAGPHDGEIRAIKSEGYNKSDINNLLFNAGILLSYSYIFGIKDLHHGNVKLDGNKLQVVDAEEVLCDLTLPSETLLLPFLNTPLQKSGLSALLTILDEKEFKTNDIIEIAKGYIFGIRLIHQIADTLRLGMSSLRNELSSIPIRVILRPTREYVQSSIHNLNIDWIEPERLQLNRGDIPYFFKFMNSESVYFYSTETWEYREIDLPHHLRIIANKVGRNPEELLDQTRIRSKLFAPGLMILLRKLASSSPEGECFSFTSQDRAVSVTASEDKIYVTSDWGAFQTSRFRTFSKHR